jgi:hypothetical protein
LALILHCLRWACGEEVGDDVDGDSVRRAAAVVAYFKAHARKCYAAMDADPRTKSALRLLRRMPRVMAEARGRHPEGCFSRRDAYRALRGRDCQSVEAVDPLLELLEKHGYIRPIAQPERRGPGRKASDLFEAHPSILGQLGQNGHNPEDEDPGQEDSVQSVQCVQGPEEDTVDEGEVP